MTKQDIFNEVGTKEKGETPNAKNEEHKTYIEEYNEFMSSFNMQSVSPEEIGYMIAKMAQHYISQNLMVIRAHKVYMKVKSNEIQQTDTHTGKPVAVSKAEIVASATSECYAYEEARAHAQNILECLNALKSLQKGVLAEYANQ